MHGHAAALAYALDQDGQLQDAEYRDRHRGLDLRRPRTAPPLDAEAWRTGTGSARTGHGYTLPAALAQKWTGQGVDARFLLALLSKTKAVEAYSSIQRCFTEQQRLALIASDGGCSHADCDAPPGYCEAHHIIEWQAGGPTSIDNATLTCSFHHRHSLEEGGWQIVMLDGVPHWIPPKYIDPEQTPRRNTRHDPPPPLD